MHSCEGILAVEGNEQIVERRLIKGSQSRDFFSPLLHRRALHSGPLRLHNSNTLRKSSLHAYVLSAKLLLHPTFQNNQKHMKH